MPLAHTRVVTAIALVLVSGILCVLLEVIGVFGLSFGGEMGLIDSLLWGCLFFFPLPLCLISLTSLRWAAALMWVNLIMFLLGQLRNKAYFNPFDNMVDAMSLSAVLLITVAFLAVAAGRWRSNTGLVKLGRSLYGTRSG